MLQAARRQPFRCHVSITSEDIEGGVDREQAVKMCLAGRGWSREHANGRAPR
jgi:hypothetical protein